LFFAESGWRATHPAPPAQGRDRDPVARGLERGRGPAPEPGGGVRLRRVTTECRGVPAERSTARR
jgi:hypothetical protein